MSERNYSLLDQIIIQADKALATVVGNVYTNRPYPAHNTEETTLTDAEKKQSAGYMRVNHTGEVCAQALYYGQAVMARSPQVKSTLIDCALEEADHLAWCQQRLSELNSHRSYLNFFWHINSFFIGMIAGYTGDKWSLGFVEETEKQVEQHLASHLNHLPTEDKKSRQIVKAMQLDEIKHGKTAADAGAAELPSIVKKLMSLQSKVMTTLAYWI